MARLDDVFRQPRTRRAVLRFGAAAALASQVTLAEQLAWLPQRAALAAGDPPDIQFDIGGVIPPAFAVDGVQVRFGPVFTLFVPIRLTRNPTAGDRRVLTRALGTIESVFPFSPAGVILILAYGLPYFRRLPASVVAAHLPRTLATGAPVLVEAVPSPTDVVRGNGIRKQTFNVPVAIEANDLLLTIRSDSIFSVVHVLAWLQGSHFLKDRPRRSPDLDGLLHFRTPRLLFQQIGLPRRIADAVGLPYARLINPRSPMWMGFADQQVNASASAPTVTFAGSATARLTTAKAGDYLDNGSIMHFSHDILDLPQFYALPDPHAIEPEGETYRERIQYMFRSNQLGTPNGIPNQGNADQFTDGGGPAFIANTFQGTDDAMRAARDSAGAFTPRTATRDATFGGEPRIGHNQALQRHSRAADGTPIHVRMDGTGFDSLDVPDGSLQPKLEFAIFMPTAQLFQTMRVGVAAQDLQAQFHVEPDDNGLERFLTATRRQNFLVPPRRHRSFPLLELTGAGGGERRPDDDPDDRPDD
jgi:hypothetical protein